MKVLSLFDGISCARVALARAGFLYMQYYASEIDKYAVKIAAKNYPDNIRLGSVTDIHVMYPYREYKTGESPQHRTYFFGDVDLLIGGSPCQDLSIAKADRKGLEGSRSSLFWEYVRILKEVRPRYFVFENVASMPAAAKAAITEALGVEPIMIDAALVSAQRRKRLFWTNIPDVRLPEDKGILLKDILEDGIAPDDKALTVQATYGKKVARDYLKKRNGQMVIIQRPRGKNAGGVHTEKSPTVSASSFEYNNMVISGDDLRKLTPIEVERLQCLPDGYTAGISDTQRYKCLGNAFNVDVVAHILRGMRA